jgi:tetratricopeptide (TPR) repeat protein
MRKPIYLVFLFLLGSQGLFGQSSVFEADKWFDNFEFEKAARIYEQNLASKKLNKERLEKLTYSHLRLGNNDRGLALVDSLIGLHKDEYEFWLWKAYFHKELSHFDQAISSIETYVQLGGPDPVNLFRANCEFLRNPPVAYEGELRMLGYNDRYANITAGTYQGNRVLLSEVGLDSTGNKFGFADNEVAFAEVMLLRPFVISGDDKNPLFLMPEGFALHSLNSFVLNESSGKVLFSSNNPIGRNNKEKSNRIYSATFNGMGNALSEVKMLFQSDWLDTVSVGHVSVNESFNVLVFSLSGAKKKDADLYVSYFTNGNWSQPANLASVNTFGDEMYPMFHDGKFLFSSNGRPGYGGLDIYQAKINAISPLDISEIEIIPSPVNSSKDDFLLFSFGKDSLLFTSNRPGGMGDDDSWLFAFPPAPIVPVEDPFNIDEFVSNWDLKRIYFDFDLSISEDDLSFVRPLVEAMEKVESMEIKLVGHTDSRGTKTYNYNLGLNRANWVKDRLIQKGIGAERIHVESVGATELVNKCTPEIFWCTEKEHRENRFVQIHLSVEP